jgi:hypothetical protein
MNDLLRIRGKKPRDSVALSVTARRGSDKHYFRASASGHRAPTQHRGAVRGGYVPFLPTQQTNRSVRKNHGLSATAGLKDIDQCGPVADLLA